MYGDLKMTFIRATLDEYHKSVQMAMRLEMDRLKANETGEGRSSIRGNTAMTGEASGQAQIIFRQYLRFVDMGVRKGIKGKQEAVRVGGMHLMKETLSNGQSGPVLKKATKPKKIYSPIAFGKISWLAAKLSYGFTEETIEILKKDLGG